MGRPMKAPWWFRRDDGASERVIGEPGPGKVLVTTARDHSGHSVERTWMDERVAWQWDETRWVPRP